ncbi:MAG TPA: pyridoxamine 5'-phosphate oxidase family protein [Solirubrobacteraceae bacterium]|nr:pyridoxamine 5'-phosphate oxidase family protein [Solirubrobacteraceae bacterium]
MRDADRPSRPASERTRVRRLPARGCYEREQIHAILDATPLGHLGLVDGGQPFVLPVLQARVEEQLYIHGSAAARWVRLLADGAPACLTVSAIDAYVLGRSVQKHSVNYRSVSVLGCALPIEEEDAKRAALEAFMERILPGRWAEVRAPDERELKAVAILSLPLAESAAKIRTGGPNDLERDLGSAVWAGVLPLRSATDEPLADPSLPAGVPLSESILALRRRIEAG